MLRTVTVRQSPTPRISPRRYSPTMRAKQQEHDTSAVHGVRFGPLLVCLFLCLAGVAVYAWPRVQVVQLAYRLQTSEQHLRDVLQAHDQLRFEAASLRDPERIYRVATEQLGMGTPRRDQVVVVTQESQSR